MSIRSVSSGIGVGIASLDSKSEEARLLREELYGIAKKKRVVRISGCTYSVRVQIFDSFGEDAFRVTIRKPINMLSRDPTPSPIDTAWRTVCVM